MSIKRRKFIKQSSLVSMGFFGLQTFVNSCKTNPGSGINSFPEKLSTGYGPLLEDPEGLLNLPKGFSYKVISKRGNPMIDGFLVPGNPDGMATFAAPNGHVVIVRNHEISPGDLNNAAFGTDMSLLDKLPQSGFYDFGRGKQPCLGGTTTIVYNTENQEVIHEYLSLTGTVRNCAGGLTPWGSWISCEENTSVANDVLEKDHGYNFEVPAQVEPILANPAPIKAMGRFNHEAVCVEPGSGIVYQTEDRHDGLIYRYLPNTPGKLLDGGQLQVLSIKSNPSFDTRNWEELTSGKMEIGKEYEVEWLNIDQVESPEDDLRFRGYDKGAARFARGEGMWYGNNEVYFACTNGGMKKQGQVFKYKPSPNEGQPQEDNQPGKLTLMVEPNNIDIVTNCDNLTVANNGHLILCEDRPTPRIVGISPKGEMYHIAKNIGVKSEFAGSTFSPDGSTLFVNIQVAGLTLAITGPWGEDWSA